MKRAHATLDPDLPAVVVTGSIAEMIGGGVTPEGTNIQRFLPRTIDEDQWQSADRAMSWLWTRVRRQEARAASRAAARPRARSRASTSSARCYGTFNMPSDLAEIRRLVEGIGAEVNMVFPLGTHLADVPQLADADVNVCMYREFGRMLCEALERPYLQAPIGLHSHDEVPAHARRAARPRPRAVHRAREAHHDQADLGPVALGDAGLLRHRELRHRRHRDLRARHPPLPRGRDGPALHLRVSRARPGVKPDNAAVREALATKPPLVLFGRYNERMYAAELRRARRSTSRRRSPAPSSAAHTGTPFMGYAGATYLVQEVCNALFDALFHILPLGTDLDRVEATPARLRRELPVGRRRAGRCSTSCVEAEPVLVRISAAKRLRDRAERDARRAGETAVTAARVALARDALEAGSRHDARRAPSDQTWRGRRGPAERTLRRSLPRQSRRAGRCAVNGRKADIWRDNLWLI